MVPCSSIFPQKSTWMSFLDTKKFNDKKRTQESLQVVRKPKKKEGGTDITSRRAAFLFSYWWWFQTFLAVAKQHARSYQHGCGSQKMAKDGFKHFLEFSPPKMGEDFHPI